MALYGVDPGPIGDVDVLLGVSDARLLLPALQLAVQPGRPDDRFRSAVFARWNRPPLAVEFMAELEVRIGAGWFPVRPRSRIAIGGVFTPDRVDLAAILRGFGRDKDVRRAALFA